MELRCCLGIAGGKERYIHAAGNESLGEKARYPLPWSVVAGRDPPRDGGEHTDPQFDHVNLLMTAGKRECSLEARERWL